MKCFRILLSFLLLQVIASAYAGCPECDDCFPRAALKTDLVHDATLTPDLGVEVALGKRWSVGAEGVWAWWGSDSSTRVWRVYGGWIELRRWLGTRAGERALTGHHIGIYGSALTYDFEFGGLGRQSPLTMGTGISYGYSIPLGKRCNMDFGIRLGYFSGKRTLYRPRCGGLCAVGHDRHSYLGPTGLSVTLLWFPGRKSTNNPVYGY